jgi:hypothetical protein
MFEIWSFDWEALTIAKLLAIGDEEPTVKGRLREMLRRRTTSNYHNGRAWH